MTGGDSQQRDRRALSLDGTDCVTPNAAAGSSSASSARRAARSHSPARGRSPAPAPRSRACERSPPQSPRRCQRFRSRTPVRRRRAPSDHRAPMRAYATFARAGSTLRSRTTDLARSTAIVVSCIVESSSPGRFRGQGALWHSMPSESREESIPSLPRATRRAHALPRGLSTIRPGGVIWSRRRGRPESSAVAKAHSGVPRPRCTPPGPAGAHAGATNHPPGQCNPVERGETDQLPRIGSRLITSSPDSTSAARRASIHAPIRASRLAASSSSRFFSTSASTCAGVGLLALEQLHQRESVSGLEDARRARAGREHERGGQHLG